MLMAGLLLGLRSPAGAAGLQPGEYACAGSGGTILIGLGFRLRADGTYTDLDGKSAGRVVFDGAPSALTDHVARELYDLEAADVMGGVSAPAPEGVPALGTAAAA